MTATDTPLSTSALASTYQTSHPRLRAWVDEVATLTQPDRIHWINGSDAEWEALTEQLVSTGTFVRLNSE